MTKQEIIDRFRQENPEITQRVISDAVLESWAEVGELEIASYTRCIRKRITFLAVVGDSGLVAETYNLATQEPLFHDIDEFPGGGIVYKDKRLEPSTFSMLDEERAGWRTQSKGVPYDYVRYNEKIVLGRPPSAAETIEAYLIVRSNAFNNNLLEPFNEFKHLTAYHYSVVLYLIRRAKGKISKKEDAAIAFKEYAGYIKWMKSEVNRGIYHEIKMRPAYHGRGYRTRR